MTTRLDVLRSCCLGSIATALMAVGALTVPRAVPLVVRWGESRGVVVLWLAVLVLLVASGAFAILYFGSWRASPPLRWRAVLLNARSNAGQPAPSRSLDTVSGVVRRFGLA